MFSSEWEPPSFGGMESGMGGFGAFHVEVVPEEDSTPLSTEQLVSETQSSQVIIPVDHGAQTVFTACVDSGATYNFVNSLALVHDFTPFVMGVQVHVASGVAVCALGHGMVGVLPFVYAPSMKCNLVSVSAMADLGVAIQLTPGGTARI